MSLPQRPVEGAAEVTFVRGERGTRLAHLYQCNPLRVLFPYPDLGDMPMATFVTTSGGLVGGDRLAIAGRVGEGAAARFGPQAAEKVYRSAGATTRVSMTLEAGDDAWLEYLPQETILFDGCRLDRQTRIDLAPGARAMAGEILVFGRLARGEVMDAGSVRDAVEIHAGGRLLWADAFDTKGGPVRRLLDHPAGLGGGRVQATLLVAGVDASSLVETVRELQAAQPTGGEAGATAMGPLLIARWVGSDGLAIRRAYAKVWQHLRHAVGGWPPVLPRVWHV